MEKLRAGDWLFIPLLDRGFRHLGDWCYQAEYFRKNKINLVVGDFPDVDLNDPMSEMWLNLMAMFAQWYRQQVSRHTKRGLAKLKSMGRPHSGSVPRGFSLRCTACQRIYSYDESSKGQACPGCKTPRKKNSKFVPNPDEQRIMWRLLWERTSHHWKAWSHVVRDLNLDGVRTRQGRKVNQNWARAYWFAAVDLLSEEKLLLATARAAFIPLWDEVTEYNRSSKGQDEYQVHFYCGQYVVKEEAP
jgi:hypothetical protein